MTPYPQGNPNDISNCNKNDATLISNDDYVIHTSSIRLPFIAAGLVNAAVAELLNQLSCRFFEMAIITSKIEDSKKESLINPNEQADNQTHNSYSNKLDNLSVLSPDHLPTLQPISQEVFTPPSSYPDVTSVTSSVSSAISLFTN
ncbi:Zinc finger protein, partial [Schistosoma japonicum]